MWKWSKRSIIGLVVFVAVAQLYRPTRTNPPVDPSHGVAAVLQTAPTVKSILSRSCGDCHSNLTVWPWYSRVAPVSWLVVSDVNRGRRRVNLSEWSMYSPQKQSKLLDEVCKEVREGDMPPLIYLSMHHSAPLTATDRQEICNWTAAARKNLPGGAEGN